MFRFFISIALAVPAVGFLAPYKAAAAAAPSITTQPQGQTNGPGVDASFTVVASGQSPLAYQWSFNGANLTNDTHIGGATSETLTISNVVFDDAGSYQVVVSNSHGEVISSNAVLGVQRVIAWGYNNSSGQCDVPPATSNAVAIACGRGSVTLRPDGTVFAWGAVEYSPTNVPATLDDVVSIATVTAGDATLAVKSDGTVAEWGSAAPPPPGLSNVLAVASTFDYVSIALKNDGTVAQWDLNGFVTNDVSAGLSNIIGIAAGVHQFLALRSNGTVVAWGDNAYGQTNVPAGLSQVVDIGGGYYYSMALKSNGDLVGWGSDPSGIISTAALMHDVVSMVCAPVHVVTLNTGGTISAWGDNGNGQLNVPTGVNRAMAIASDYEHALAILGGRNPPQIFQQPAGLTAVARQSVLFKVSAVGNIPLGYQWQFDGTNISGATGPTLLLTDVQPSQGGFYSVVITNAYGSLPSSNAVLTIVPAMFTGNPQSQSVVQGTTAVFSATARSGMPLSYQWQFDGAALPGQTNSILTLDNVQTNEAGDYNVVASNAYGSITSAVASLTVLVPPYFTWQPSSQTAVVGSNATFTALAGGTSPLAYQWQRDGTNLMDGGRVSGSTTTNLEIAAVQTADAASYRLVAANMAGSVTSAEVTLKVLVPPTLAGQLTNRVVLLGSTTVFYVEGEGTEPLVYQWQKDGTNLVNGERVSGATGPALTISNVQMSDLGDYRLVLSNAAGFVASAEARLWVVPVLAWGNNDHGQTNVPLTLTNVMNVVAGSSHNLALLSDGTIIQWGTNGYDSRSLPPIGLGNIVAVSARWYNNLALRSDGTVVEWGYVSYGQYGYGPLSAPEELTNVSAVAAGGSHGLALKSDGTVVDWGYVATPPPGLTNVLAIAAGGYHDLALKDDGTVVCWGDNTYQQSTPPSGLSNVVAIAAGSYFSLALKSDGTVIGWGNYRPVEPAGLSNVVAVTAGQDNVLALKSGGSIIGWGNDSYGQATPPANASNVVALATGGFHSLALEENPATQVPPGLWWQSSTSRTVPTGRTVLFKPCVTGSLPLKFQWYFNGLPLSEETNGWLILTSVRPEQAGDYQFVAENNFGAVTGQVVTVSELPGILVQPHGQIAFLSSNASIAAAVSGVEPLNYQWYFNGAPLADSARVMGSTTTNLDISNVQFSDGGTYTLVITNSTGSTTSTAASLTIASQPPAQTVWQGSGATFAVSTSGPAVFFQWTKDGVILTNGGRVSGATSRVLTISNCQTNDSGGYRVIMTNSSSAATSSVAMLTVVIPAVITNQPVSQAVLIGNNAVFTVGASAASGYQWYFNGTPLSDGGRISGSGTAALTISTVESSDAGGYTVVASNSVNAAVSITASLTALTSLAPSIRYVNVNSPEPSSPYLDWSTAATNIQDAIDASVDGDLVLVTNGVYQAGGRVTVGLTTNRVAVTKAVTLKSVNGPSRTFIQGYQASVADSNFVRCVYLASGATLSGFTLTNGGTRYGVENGGGVYAQSTGVIVTNCILTGNAASQGAGAYQATLKNCELTGNSADSGGGAAYSLLYNCTLTTNSAYSAGGGVYRCTNYSCVLTGNSDFYHRSGGASASALYNCVLTGNTSGALSSTLYNCTVVGNDYADYTGSGGYGILGQDCIAYNSIIYFNPVTHNGGNWGGGTLVNCCTFPLPGGAGNFTNAPLFVDQAGGDFRLQSNSPCINSGNNAYVVGAKDLGGNARIVGGTVDVGAYEFQSPGSVLSYAWAQQYGLPTDGSADYADSDADGLNNWQEWRARTNPRDALSVLKMLTLSNSAPGLTVTWQSVGGVDYFLQRGDNLGAQPAFSTIESNVVGQAGATSFTDTNAIGSGPYFYRVGVP